MRSRNGAPVQLSIAVAALIVSFLPWQSVDFLGISVTASEWHGVGVIAGLLLVAHAAWSGVRMAGVAVGVPPALPAAAGALLLALLTLVKVLVDAEARTAWAWIGLLLALLLAAVASAEAAPLVRALRAMRSGTLPGAAPAAPRAPAATPTTRSGEMSGIDGEWTCTMDTPMGRQSVALTLSTEGGELSGQANTAFGVQTFSGGTVDGNDLAWHITVTQPMPLELDFAATVDGDTLAGTVKAGPLGESPFTGTRA